jgi:hypothetical protein
MKLSPDYSYKDMSAQAQALYRRAMYRCAHIQKLSKQVEMLCAIHRIPFKKEIRAAASPPLPELIRAEINGMKYVVKGERKLRSSLVEGFSWAPFHKIPNVKEFQVNVAEIDKVFAHFGIKKNMSATAEFSYYKNRAAIRYAVLMITKMRNTRNDALY